MAEGTSPDFVWPVKHRAKAEAAIAAAFSAVAAARAAVAGGAAAARAAAGGESGASTQSGHPRRVAIGAESTAYERGSPKPPQAADDTSEGQHGRAVGCFSPPEMSEHPAPLRSGAAGPSRGGASATTDTGGYPQGAQAASAGEGDLEGCPVKVVTAAHLHSLVMAALLCKERVGSRRGRASPSAPALSDDGSEDDDDVDVESAVQRADRILRGTGTSSQQQHSQRWSGEATAGASDASGEGGADGSSALPSRWWWTAGAGRAIFHRLTHTLGGGRIVFWRRRKPEHDED